MEVILCLIEESFNLPCPLIYPPPPFPFPYQVGGTEKGEGEGIGTREAEKNGVGSDS